MAFATFNFLPTVSTSPASSRAAQQKRARSILTPRRCRRIPCATLEQPAARTDTTSSPSSVLPSEGYNWENQWYPVSFERDVLDDVPYAFSVFDRKLVLFRTRPGEYSILDDRCSHRLAPLSEGRIIPSPNSGDDTVEKVIECAYHGWSFKGCGGCACIPQLTDGAKIPRRSSVRAYRYKAYLGVIWIWFGIPKDADVSLLPTGRILEEVGIDGVSLKMNWSRIVPYGFEALLENVLDPHHVNWAHHGARAFFRRQYGASPPKRIVNLMGDTGFNNGALHYNAPITCVYAFPFIPYMEVMFIVLPISRYTSRMFMIEIHKPAPPLPLLQRVGWKSIRNKLRPIWAQHLEVCMTTDGDNILVHEVENNIEMHEEGTASWKETYLPINIDSLVVELRKWLDARRSYIPWISAAYDSSVADAFTRYDMIERWDSHTKDCQICSGALKGWKRVHWVVNKMLNLALLFVLLIVSAMSAILLVTDDVMYLDNAADKLLLKPAVVSSVVLVVLVLFLWRLRKMCRYYIEQFTYTDEARRLYLTF